MRKQKVTNPESTLAKLRKILERVDGLPNLDNRTADEILGYDENGLPDGSRSDSR